MINKRISNEPNHSYLEKAFRNCIRLKT
ncbi:MAG: hypothetical protein RL152_1040, partial [Bacteroidota bacterium]